MNIVYRGDDGHVQSLGETSELRHWKYIKKLPVGKGFRYFYSWDEYRAYLADPTAELQKTGQNAANQLQSAGRRAGQEIKSAGRSTQKYVAKGRKAVEKAVGSKDRSKMTVSGIKRVNASRPASFRKRMNDLAKRIGEKWKGGTEAVKETIEKGKKWVDDLKVKRKEAIEVKKETENKKREQLAKKYKYIKKITKNGKTYYFYTQDELRAYQERKEYYKNDPDFMKEIKHSNVPYTASEDLMLVNPNFDMYDADARYEYNCAECSAIYELRRRGYDVESNGESGIGDKADEYNTEKRFDLFYENANVQKPKATNTDEETYNVIKSEIEKNPPGSRGDLSVAWKDGGGHSMVWERDSNGTIHIIDSQMSGDGGRVEFDLRTITDMADNSSSTGKEWGMKKNKPVTTVTRTDNLRLRKDITNICKESSDRKKRPHTKDKMTIDPEKGVIHYVPMTEKEITTEYSNLLTQRSKY